MIRNALIGLAVLLSLVTITGNATAAELLPLAPGNGWIYRDAVTGDSFSVQVGAQVYLNQHLYHTLRGYGISTLLVRVNQYGNIVYWDEERAQDILLISFESVPRAWWEAPMRECPQQGQTTGSRTAHTGPGGKWEALDIQYRSFECFDAGSESEQFQHELVIRGGFSATLEVPHPSSTPEGPHFYTIEAWLTSAEGESRFAAVTVVGVGHSRPSSNYLERDGQ